MISFNNKKWKINRFLNQGKDIYIMFDPYAFEIRERTWFIYGFTNEAVCSSFNRLREEV